MGGWFRSPEWEGERLGRPAAASPVATIMSHLLSDPRTIEQALADLQAIYEMRPSPDLARMIEQLAAEFMIRERRRTEKAGRPPQLKEGA